MINEELTFKLFGYTSFNIIIGYRRPFIRSCDKCGKNEALNYLDDNVSDLCRPCRTKESWINANERRKELIENNPSKRPEVRELLSRGKLSDKNPNYGKSPSPETRQKQRDKSLGVKLSPEVCRIISNKATERYKDQSERDKQSERTQKRYDEMDDPGQEICMHHYVYDFNDLDKYRIPVTRSEHSIIHADLRRAGLEVPCINIMKEDD